MNTKKLTTEERAQLVYEHLKDILPGMEKEGLGEFCKGGISACCTILDIVNPYTGNKYEGDLTELSKI